jgi:hypothetical protein
MPITIHDVFKKKVVLVREQCKSYGCNCTTLLPSVIHVSYFACVGVTVLLRHTKAVDKLWSSQHVDRRFLSIALECRKAQIKKISSEIYMFVKFNPVSNAVHKPS